MRYPQCRLSVPAAACCQLGGCVGVPDDDVDAARRRLKMLGSSLCEVVHCQVDASATFDFDLPGARGCADDRVTGRDAGHVAGLRGHTTDTR